MSCAIRYIPATPNPTTLMGKGDKRSKKGKIYRGTYGKRRLRKAKAKGAAKGKTAAAKRA